MIIAATAHLKCLHRIFSHSLPSITLLCSSLSLAHDFFSISHSLIQRIFNILFQHRKEERKKNWPSNSKHTQRNATISYAFAYFLFRFSKKEKREWAEREKGADTCKFYNQSLWNMQNLNVVDYCCCFLFYFFRLDSSFEPYKNAQNHKQSPAFTLTSLVFHLNYLIEIWFESKIENDLIANTVKQNTTSNKTQFHWNKTDVKNKKKIYIYVYEILGTIWRGAF